MITEPRIWQAGRAGVAAAAAAIRTGAVIGFPTDTVYGVGCSATDGLAVAHLFQIKSRPQTHPLILMAASTAELESLVLIDRRAQELSDRFWPGPLTLILPSRPGGVGLAAAATVGVRVPAHPLALELLLRTGVLATSSANRHGHPPVANAAAALAELPGLAGALTEADGPGRGGDASSILDLTGRAPVLIRRGRLSAQELGIPFPAEESGLRRD